MDAAGILHPTHRLVVIPDDPRLGEYREAYVGLVGMLVERPEEGPDNTPGFAGSTRISGTDTFLDEMEAGPCDRPDARAYLKARFFDMVVGDRDRHQGQWRWAMFPEGDCRLWQPVPEDRDQAFVDYDGFILSMYRRSSPQQVRFQAKYPHIGGLTFNGWEVDREMLVELDEGVWQTVARELQRELTDAVIEDAVRRLPPAHYSLIGEFLEDAIKSRRDDLRTAALKYYRMMSREPEIKATDQAEYAEFEHMPDGKLDVRIGLLDGGDGNRAEPYLQRTFHPGVTREVRVYLRGGDDRVQVLGGKGRITVRAIGGGGDDQYVNASETGGRGTRFYDSRGQNQFDEGKGAHVNEKPYERPPAQDQAHRFALDWGGRPVSFPLTGYNPDLGFFFGIRRGTENYGFRKDPFKSQHVFTLGFATAGPEAFLGYEGRLRQIGSGMDALFNLEYTGINILRFHGFGNETPRTESGSFYRVRQREVQASLGLEWTAGGNRGGMPGGGSVLLRPTFRFGFGPILKYASTPESSNDDRFIGSLDPAPYGTGSFGEFGGQAWLTVDTRDNSGMARKGVLFDAGGSFYPSLWDVQSTFGEAHGKASVYLTVPGSAGPTLALRAGGKKLWGDYPFFEAAFLGGGSSLRGFYRDRFAGDAMAFGNAELRLGVAHFNMMVPTQFGIFGIADAGRVFFDGDPSDADTWHKAFGGGVWFSFVNRMQSVSIGIVNGDDLTGVYVDAGFMF
jgi:hypothetical protein